MPGLGQEQLAKGEVEHEIYLVRMCTEGVLIANCC